MLPDSANNYQKKRMGIESQAFKIFFTNFHETIILSPYTLTNKLWSLRSIKSREY